MDDNPLAALLAQHQNDTTVLDEHFEKNQRGEVSSSSSEEEVPIGLTVRQPSFSSLHDKLVEKSGKVVTDLEDAVEDPIIVLDDKSDKDDCPIGLTYRQPSFASLDGSSMVGKGGESLRDIKPVRTIPIEEVAEVPEENPDEDPETAFKRELEHRNMERWKLIGYEPDAEKPRQELPTPAPLPVATRDKQSSDDQKSLGKHRRAGSDGMKLGEASESLARMQNALMLDKGSEEAMDEIAEEIEEEEEETEDHEEEIENHKEEETENHEEETENHKEEETQREEKSSSSSSEPSVQAIQETDSETVQETKETKIVTEEKQAKRVFMFVEDPEPISTPPQEPKKKVVTMKRETQVVYDAQPRREPRARTQKWSQDETFDFFSRDEDEFSIRRSGRAPSPTRYQRTTTTMSRTRGQAMRGQTQQRQRPRGQVQQTSFQQKQTTTTRLRPHPRQELGTRTSRRTQPKSPPKATPTATKQKQKQTQADLYQQDQKQAAKDSESRAKALEQANVSIDDEPRELFGNLAKIVTEESGTPIHQLLASGNTNCISPNDLDTVIARVTEYRDTCIDRIWIDETSYLNMVLNELASFNKTVPQNETEEGMSEIEIAKAKAEKSAEKYKKLIASEKLKLKAALQLLDDEYRTAAAALDQKYQSDELIQKYNKPSRELLEMRQACKRLLRSERIEDARRMTARIQEQEKKEAKEMTSKLRHKYHDADRRLKERFAVRRELIERRSACQIQMLEHHRKEAGKKHKARIAELENSVMDVLGDPEATAEAPAPLNVRPPKLISRDNDTRVIEVMSQEIARGKPVFEIDIEAAFRKSRR